MTVPSLSLPSRLWLSWASAFKILFDGSYAARVAELEAVVQADAALPPSADERKPTQDVSTPNHEALQLLSLLQREGRFVDFVEQEIASFSDADIGAAARVVHEGCRRALHEHGRIVSVRTEREGAPLTLEQATADVKLVGNVAGTAPFRGVLRHRGWRLERLTLPKLIGAHDPQLIAPAELELS